MNPAALRKAAILISTLDTASTDALLAQMPPEYASRVRHAVFELGDVSLAEEQQVLEEFKRRRPALAGTASPGVELDQELARKLESADPAPPPDAPHGAGGPFRFLHEATGEMLARMLSAEHPQTIAAVVAHLKAEQAAALLVELPAALQTEVLLRVANLEDLAPEVLAELEREIEQRFASQLRTLRRRSAGVAAVKAILRATDFTDRQVMLARLTDTDESLADAVSGAERTAAPVARSISDGPTPTARAAASTAEPRVATQFSRNPAPSATLTFADLERLEDQSLLQLLGVADPQAVGLALAGAAPRLVDRVSQQLPGRMARALRRQMQQLAPLRLDDVERAQQHLVQLCRDLVARGAIRPPGVGKFAAA